MAEYREPLYNELPDYVRYSGDELGTLEDFCDALQLEFDEYWRLKDAIQAIYTIDYTPASWLDWLGQLVGLAGTPGRWLGIGLNPDWSADQKRKVIKEAGTYWRRKGTLAGIRKAIALWLQWDQSSDRFFLDFRHPFGREYSDTPQQWHSWFIPYRTQELQNYKELQYFGSKAVPTPYQPFLYEIQNEKDSWRWQEPFHTRIFNRVRVDRHEYAKTGNSPNHMRAHFRLSAANWNQIVPYIHDLNKEIWDAATEPFIFAWDKTLKTDIKLYENYQLDTDSSVFGRQLKYTLDGYDWRERYPRLQEPKARVVRETVRWQDHFVANEGFSQWGTLFGSYSDRVLPPETYYEWVELESSPHWGSDWQTPYMGEGEENWQEEVDSEVTKPAIVSHTSGWGTPYAHYWEKIEDRTYTTTQIEEKEYLASTGFWDWPSQWHGRSLRLPQQQVQVETAWEVPARNGRDWLAPFGRFADTQQTQSRKQNKEITIWDSQGNGWFHPYLWYNRKRTITKIEQTIVREKIDSVPFSQWGTPYGHRGGIPFPVEQRYESIAYHQQGHWGTDWHDRFYQHCQYTRQRSRTQQVWRLNLESKDIDWLAPYLPSRIPPTERFRQEQRQQQIVTHEARSRGWDWSYVPSESPPPTIRTRSETIETYSPPNFGEWGDRYMSLGGLPLPPKTWVEFVPYPHYEARYEKWGYPYAYAGTRDRTWQETVETIFYVPKAGFPDWLSPYQPAARPQNYPRLQSQSSRRYLTLKPEGLDWLDSYSTSLSPPPQIERTEVEVETIDREGFATWLHPYGHTGGVPLSSQQQSQLQTQTLPALAGGDWLSTYMGTFQFREQITESYTYTELLFSGDRSTWHTPYQPPARPIKYPTEEVTTYSNRIHRTPYSRGWHQAYPYSDRPIVVEETTTEQVEKVDNENFAYWGDPYGSHHELLLVPPDRRETTTTYVSGYPGGDWQDSYIGKWEETSSTEETITEQVWMPGGAAWGAAYPYTLSYSQVEERFIETIERLQQGDRFARWGTIYGSSRRPLPLPERDTWVVEVAPHWGAAWYEAYPGSGEQQVETPQTITEQVWMPSGAAWGAAYPYSLEASWVEESYQEIREEIDGDTFARWETPYGGWTSPIKAPEKSLVTETIGGYAGGDWWDTFSGRSYNAIAQVQTQEVRIWEPHGAAWGAAYPYNLQKTRYQESELEERIGGDNFARWQTPYGARSRPVKAPSQEIVAQNVSPQAGCAWSDPYLGWWTSATSVETSTTVATFASASASWQEPYAPNTAVLHDRAWETRDTVQEGDRFASWESAYGESEPFYLPSRQWQEPILQERTFPIDLRPQPFTPEPLLKEAGNIIITQTETTQQQEGISGVRWMQSGYTSYQQVPTQATTTEDVAYTQWHLTYQEYEVLVWREESTVTPGQWQNAWLSLLSPGYDVVPTVENSGETETQEYETITWQEQTYAGSRWQQSDRERSSWQTIGRTQSDDILFATWHQTYLYQVRDRVRLVHRTEIPESTWEAAWLPILSPGYDIIPIVENTGETVETTIASQTTTSYSTSSFPYTSIGHSYIESQAGQQTYSDEIPYTPWHLVYQYREVVHTNRYLAPEIPESIWEAAWLPILSPGYDITPVVENTGETVEKRRVQEELRSHEAAGVPWHQSDRLVLHTEVVAGTPEYRDEVAYIPWHLYYRSFELTQTTRRTPSMADWQQAWQNKMARPFPPTPIFNYWVESNVPQTQNIAISHQQWLQLFHRLPIAGYGGMLQAQVLRRTQDRTFWQTTEGAIAGTPHPRQEQNWQEYTLLPHEQRFTPQRLFARWHQLYQVSVEVREQVVPRSLSQWLAANWQKVGTPGFSMYPILAEGQWHTEIFDTTIPMPQHQWLQTFSEWKMQAYAATRPVTVEAVATLRTEIVQRSEQIPVESPAMPWLTYNVWYEYVPEQRQGAPRYSSPNPGSPWARTYYQRQHIFEESVAPPANWAQQWHPLIGLHWEETPLYDRLVEQSLVWVQVPVSDREWNRKWRFFYGQRKYAMCPIIYNAVGAWQQEVVSETILKTLDFPGVPWQQPERSYTENVLVTSGGGVTPQIVWTPYHLLYSYEEKTIPTSHETQYLSEDQWIEAWLPLASAGYQPQPTLSGRQEMREVEVEVQEAINIDIPHQRYRQPARQWVEIEMVPEGDRYTPEIPSRPWFGTHRQWMQENTIEQTNYVSRWQESWRNKVSKGYALKPEIFITWYTTIESSIHTHSETYHFHGEPWTLMGYTLQEKIAIPGRTSIFPKQPYTSYYGMPRHLEGSYEAEEVVQPQQDCVPGLKVDMVVDYEEEELPAVPPHNVPLYAAEIKEKYKTVIVREEHPGWSGFQWYQKYVDYPPAPVSLGATPTLTADLEGLGEAVQPNASIKSVGIEMPMPYELATYTIVLSLAAPFTNAFEFKYTYDPLDISESKPVFDTDSMWHMRRRPEISENRKVRDRGLSIKPPRIVAIYHQDVYGAGYHWYHSGFGGSPSRSIQIPVYEEVEYCNVPDRYTTRTTDDWQERLYVSPVERKPLGDRYELLKRIGQMDNWELVASTSEGEKQIPPISFYVVQGDKIASGQWTSTDIRPRSNKIDFLKGFDTLYMEFANRMPNTGRVDSITLWLKGYGFVSFRGYAPMLNYTSKEVAVFPVLVSLKEQFPVVSKQYLEVDSEDARLATSHLNGWGLNSATIDLNIPKSDRKYLPNF